MDPIQILELVTKGIVVIEALVTAGENALPAIEAIKTVLVDKKEPTQADLDRIETVLDELIDEFGIPLPPET